MINKKTATDPDKAKCPPNIVNESASASEFSVVSSGEFI